MLIVFYKKNNESLNEDTFIFAVERRAQLFLVSESTVDGRATYIFKANIDTYVDVVHAIYDYIGSPRKAKRMSLRKRDADTTSLGYDGYVTHSAFDHWQQKLETVFNFNSGIKLKNRYLQNVSNISAKLINFINPGALKPSYS